jgi:hypothetical protein
MALSLGIGAGRAQIGGPAVAVALTSLLVASIAVAASSTFFLAAVMTVYLLFCRARSNCQAQLSVWRRQRWGWAR